ncbi:MAG: lipid A deacylase LpxR family protein [Gammaproteobacteria bacterium]
MHLIDARLKPAAALVVLAALAIGSDAHADAAADCRDADAGPSTFTLMFENDLFGDSDRQYTNGLKATLMSPDLKRLECSSAVPAWLRRALGGINGLERVFISDPAREFNVGVGLGQMMFTPDDTQRTDLVIDDRPYAGWFYGALTLVSKDDEVADTLEIQLGIIGPDSLAEDAQKFVHDIRDLPLPRGWDNQLDNEPGLLVYYERKWRFWGCRAGAADCVRRDGFAWDSIWHGGIALGNVTDYLALGGELRVGWNLPNDFGTSLIRPGGDASAPNAAGATTRRPGAYVFAAFSGRAVARDIFLDGNTFSDSHDVDKKHFVGDLVLGASAYYGPLKLSYAQVFRTREFDGQDRRHNFGSLSVSLSF